MTNDGTRTVDIRLIVIVAVDVAAPALADIVEQSGRNPPSVADIVSSEVLSNLESVRYVEAVTVSQLLMQEEEPCEIGSL